jgi:hypothetical protein
VREIDKIIKKLSENIIFNADDNSYYLWNSKYWQSIQLNTLLNYLYISIKNELNKNPKFKYTDDNLLKKIKSLVNTLKITNLIPQFSKKEVLNF